MAKRGLLKRALGIPEPPDRAGTFVDHRFGVVRVAPGKRYTVEGDRLPRVTITGIASVDADGREAETGTAVINVGHRGADNAWVRLDGRKLQLRHVADDRAELFLDGARVARARRTGERREAAFRHERTDYDVTWEADVTPLHASLGHLLLSRYGAGQPGAFRRVLGPVWELRKPSNWF